MYNFELDHPRRTHLLYRDADSSKKFSKAKIRVCAALLKIKSTTYKLFFAIFLTTVLL